jgi:DNA invertase Pin-like site-specific DNA recombinase
MPANTVAPLRFIGLTRKSKGEDEGTHLDQRRIIEERAAREGFKLVRTDKEHQVSGAKSWRDREVGRAIEDVKAGRADGIIVAYEDRITRERLLAAAEIWQAMEDAGVIFIACDGVDSRREDSEFSFGINALLARKQWKNYQRRSNDGRRRAVEDEGVHGGDSAPLGYSWTDRVGGAKNVSGNVKHGPLTPNADAQKVRAAFEARVDGASWREVIKILGCQSQGAAASLIGNRVYLGEAKSGTFVKVGAHKEIVDEALWNRAQRRQKAHVRRTREGVAVLAKVLRCGTCDHTMTYDASMAKPGYRCKNITCPSRATINAAAIEPHVLADALGWHAAQSPGYLLSREVEDAMLPALEDALADAEAAVEEIKASESLSALRRAEALTEADAAVATARAALESAEAGTGWLSLTPERVAEKLDGADVETVRGFIQEQVRVRVFPCGRGKQVPVAERIKTQYLTAGKTAEESLVPGLIPDGLKFEAAVAQEVEVA